MISNQKCKILDICYTEGEWGILEWIKSLVLEAVDSLKYKTKRLSYKEDTGINYLF